MSKSICTYKTLYVHNLLFDGHENGSEVARNLPFVASLFGPVYLQAFISLTLISNPTYIMPGKSLVCALFVSGILFG